MTKTIHFSKGFKQQVSSGKIARGNCFYVIFGNFLPNLMNLILSQNRENSTIAIKTSWYKRWVFQSGYIRSSANPLTRKIVTKLEEKNVKNNNKFRSIYSRKIY